MVKSYPNHNKIAALIPNSVSGPFYTFFSSKNGIFHKLLAILIYKKLHLILLFKMEVQTENGDKMTISH